MPGLTCGSTTRPSTKAGGGASATAAIFLCLAFTTVATAGEHVFGEEMPSTLIESDNSWPPTAATTTVRAEPPPNPGIYIL